MTAGNVEAGMPSAAAFSALVASLCVVQEIAHESGKKWACSGESVMTLPGPGLVRK